MKINEKFKRAIVTGGAGFIGSHLVEELLLQGLEVISIDDYSGGKAENLQHLKNNSNFREVNCDVTNFEALSPYFPEVDIVFHQACSKNTVCMKNPARDLAVNAEGTLNMLHQAKAHGVKKFIHASTGSVYGEPYIFPSDESHPLNPVSYYGVSKLGGEKYVRLFSDLHGMDTVILRYYHVFGPRQEYSDVGGVVSIFGRRAVQGKPLIIYGDGTQLRSFTYVQDVVGINLLVAMTDGISGEAYNCASGIKVTIQELAETVLQYFGREYLEIQYQDWKPGDIKKFDVDNSKLKSLGFNFQYDFKTGLYKTLDWSKNFFGF
jgi:nucleoside-diphosphate-sugar epimerase